jgi:hypothetical protein
MAMKTKALFLAAAAALLTAGVLVITGLRGDRPGPAPAPPPDDGMHARAAAPPSHVAEPIAPGVAPPATKSTAKAAEATAAAVSPRLPLPPSKPLDPKLVDSVKAALQQENEGERAQMLMNLAYTVFDDDPAKGLRAIEIMDSEADMTVFATEILDLLMTRDPRQAQDWASQLTVDEVKRSAYELIGKRWAGSRLDMAMNWVGSLKEPSLQASALDGVLSSWPRDALDVAADWVSELPLENETVRAQATAEIAKMMALEDPGAAARYAIGFPDGHEKRQALEFAVAQWAPADLDQAVEWIDGLPDDASREIARIAVARSWANIDPEGATKWAAGLAEEEARRTAVLNTVRKWLASDPVPATAWIEDFADADLQRELAYRAGSVAVTGDPKVGSSDDSKR